MSIWVGPEVDALVKALERFISNDHETPERKVAKFSIFIKDTDGIYHAFNSKEDGTMNFVKEVMGE